MHALFIDKVAKGREASEIKSALHEQPPCESFCDDTWIIAPKQGLYQSSDTFLFTEIALTVLTNTRKKKLRGTKICRAVAQGRYARSLSSNSGCPRGDEAFVTP